MSYEVTLETNYGKVWAIWEGRAYITLHTENSESPYQAVNVWDYEKDEPIIPLSAKAMAEYLMIYLIERHEEYREEHEDQLIIYAGTYLETQSLKSLSQ